MSTDKEVISLEERPNEGDRLFSPSTARNKEVVGEMVARYLPKTGTILEVGAGTGEHAVHFAARLPNVKWLPGDPDEASRASIGAWTEHLNQTQGQTNVAPPHKIDVCTKDWGLENTASLAGIVTLNMIHISPFASTQGLFAGAERYLNQDGVLFMYGPFARDGRHTAPSNEAFDASLKSRNPQWGVRDLERDIMPLAAKAGLTLQAVEPMPANNNSVIFTKRS